MTDEPKRLPNPIRAALQRLVARAEVDEVERTNALMQARRDAEDRRIRILAEVTENVPREHPTLVEALSRRPE